MGSKINHTTLILFLLFTYSQWVQAQQKNQYLQEAIPFITNYSPESYQGHGQVWKAVQDSHGIMYFSNNENIMAFDGHYWQHYAASKGGLVRALAIDEHDRIFVGSVGDIGYLEIDSSGKLYFKSFLAYIPEPDRKFEDVWGVEIYQGKIYYRTSTRIYIVSNWEKGHHPQVKVWKYPPRWRLNLLKDQNGQLYFTHYDGIGKIEADTFHLIPHSPIITQLGKVIYIHRTSDSTYFVGTTLNGIFSLNASATNPHQAVQALGEAFTDTYHKGILYTGIPLSDGLHAFGTLRSGLLIINEQGDLQQQITSAQGLADDVVRALYQTREGSLFALTNKGISNIEVNFPIRQYNKSKGYQLNSVTAIHRHTDGTLYMGGSDYVYYLDQKANKFQKVKHSFPQNWDITAVGSSKNKRLLVASSNGLFEIKNNEAIIIDRNRSHSFVKSQVTENLTIVLQEGGFSLIDRLAEKWLLKKVNILNYTFWDGCFDSSGNLWLDTRYNGIIKINAAFFSQSIQTDTSIPEVFMTQYDTLSGLPSNSHNYIFQVNQQIYISNRAGIYAYHPLQDHFYKDSINFEKIESTEHHRYREIEKFIDKNNQFWPITHHQQLSQISHHPALKRNAMAFGGANGILVETDGTVWFGNKDGLYQYDSKSDWQPLKPATLIRKVILNEDVPLFWGNTTKDNSSIGIHELDYSETLRLTFQYAAIHFSERDELKYSYRLKGNNEQWSDWSAHTAKSFTNLWEGDYTFQVKAKDNYGIESNIANYQFEIQPPWFRSAWAYTGYLIIMGFLIWLLLKFNSYRLHQQNKQLEQVILVRTQEIQEKNEELQQKNEAQNRLMAIIGHDLQSPLYSLQGSLAFAQQIGEQGVNQQEFFSILKQIENEFTSVIGLINSLLYWSLNRQDAFQVQKEVLDVTALIEEVIQLDKSAIQKKNMILDTSLPQNLLCDLDRKMLYFILRNLLANAIKFTPIGGEIQLKVEIQKENLSLSVIDNGIGINPDKLNDLFSQVDPNKVTPDAFGKIGTGLGLAVAYEFAQKMDGYITVESQLNIGSTFCVFLPNCVLEYEQNDQAFHVV